ncbi:GPI ethanolamine phosphate transferase 3 [Yarrowia sp. C11]|nr:GPI ethanolamine phosphate transferase 3 [Yarrowia sp. E02]KAG5371809.1 GPI ethanolamine phosphate transferase 3 [Yarrowia sp. C11]
MSDSLGPEERQMAASQRAYTAASRGESVETPAVAYVPRTMSFNWTWKYFIGLFLWMVLYAAIGVGFFTRGFLLSRSVLTDVSPCNWGLSELHEAPGPVQGGCWTEPKFEKTIMLVIDALRFDFSTPQPGSDKPYHNALTVMSELNEKQPNQAFLSKFVADPPTTTLQRLKGLTTGSLPTFIDAGSNFAGSEIDEDNWVYQMWALNQTVYQCGDDTWQALFGKYFADSNPYESLNVWDLYSVDNGVKEHLMPAYHSGNYRMNIGHTLGVDHAGHRYGPDSPKMTEKLQEMDEYIREIIDAMDDETLLIVFGDHGMDSKGDHGGESDLEVDATLFMYARKDWVAESAVSKGEYPSIPQIDLVPTLSLLMGIPIPFNNLGSPISEAFLGPEKNPQALANALQLTSAQIENYRQKYGFDGLGGLYEKTVKVDSSKANMWESVISNHYNFQRSNLDQCRSLWAQFDFASIFAGFGIIGSSLILLVLYSRLPILDVEGSLEKLCHYSGISAFVTAPFFYALASYGAFGQSWPFDSLWTGGLGFCVGTTLGYSIYYIRHFSKNIARAEVGTIAVILITIIHVALFSSNSFTIWEDNILSFLMSTIGFGLLINAAQLPSTNPNRAKAISHSIIFLILTRASAFSRLCREEHGDKCSTTFYSSDASSVSAPYTVALLALGAFLLPLLVKGFLIESGSDHGSAKFHIWGLFGVMMSVAMYWFLDLFVTEQLRWSDPLFGDIELLSSMKLTIARIVLGVTLLAANVSWMFGLCVEIKYTKKDGVTQAQILGYSNVYGAQYLLLVLNFFGAILLVSKPLGGVMMTIQMYHIMTTIDLLHILETPASIGPVILAVLGNSYFFSTGHQATIPSVQWDIGFVATNTISFPLTHLAIVLNSLGPQILSTFATPLLALWKIPPVRKPSLLFASCGQSMLVSVAYQTAVTLSAAVFATHFRRHLMVWKIFAPRYMLGGLTLIVVNVVAVLVIGFGVGNIINHVRKTFGTGSKKTVTAPVAHKSDLGEQWDALQ